MLTPHNDHIISAGRESALLQRLWYLFLVFIIGVVCVYDNVLNVCFASDLPEVEQNPLCRLIIHHYGGVKQLILVKSYLTIIGISILIFLVYTRFNVCVKIMFGLSMILFFYLTFYCPEGDYNIHRIIKENMYTKSPIRQVYDFYFVNTFEENSKLLNPKYPRFRRY